MKLIIGGNAQGKLDYVLEGKRVTDFCIVDGGFPDAEQLQESKDNGKTVILNHFHEWMKAGIRQGGKYRAGSTGIYKQCSRLYCD